MVRPVDRRKTVQFAVEKLSLSKRRVLPCRANRSTVRYNSRRRVLNWLAIERGGCPRKLSSITNAATAATCAEGDSN